MSRILCLEATGYTKYLFGEFYDGQRTYQITVCEYFDANAAHTWRELINVQLDDCDIVESDPVWKQITREL